MAAGGPPPNNTLEDSLALGTLDLDEPFNWGKALTRSQPSPQHDSQRSLKDEGKITHDSESAKEFDGLIGSAPGSHDHLKRQRLREVLLTQYEVSQQQKSQQPWCPNSESASSLPKPKPQ